MSWPEWISPDGRVRLINADCLEVLPELEAGSVDAIVTDPPYCSGGYLEAQKNTKAQGLRGATVAADDFEWFQADNMSTMGLIWLMRQVMVQSNRILAGNRSALMFTDWRMVPHLAPALESSGLRYRNMIIWDKGSAGLGVGFKPSYEVVLEFCKGSTDYQRLDGQNVIRQSRMFAQAKEHNAQKPVELIEHLLGMIAADESEIVDPFAGSCTTAIACIRTDRRCICIEKEAKYFQIGIDRCKREYARTALFDHAEATA